MESRKLGYEIMLKGIEKILYDHENRFNSLPENIEIRYVDIFTMYYTFAVTCAKKQFSLYGLTGRNEDSHDIAMEVLIKMHNAAINDRLYNLKNLYKMIKATTKYAVMGYTRELHSEYIDEMGESIKNSCEINFHIGVEESNISLHHKIVTSNLRMIPTSLDLAVLKVAKDNSDNPLRIREIFITDKDFIDYIIDGNHIQIICIWCGNAKREKIGFKKDKTGRDFNCLSCGKCFSIFTNSLYYKAKSSFVDLAIVLSAMIKENRVDLCILNRYVPNMYSATLRRWRRTYELMYSKDLKKYDRYDSIKSVYSELKQNLGRSPTPSECADILSLSESGCRQRMNKVDLI